MKRLLFIDVKSQTFEIYANIYSHGYILALFQQNHQITNIQ
jgi:hypothetical protein